MTTGQARLIAFYLPQFHPIAENDGWWGKGFTEWTNVAQARSLFPGHRQPRVPADLGFYDLRLPETRAAQAELAARHGIEGFCYWHYWFHGRRLLERPFNEVLASGRPDFPFCLAWANESWSRRWLGEELDILQKQSYSEEDDRQHARWLARVLADPRNIRVNGRPLFLIYKPDNLPDPRRTADAIRDEAGKNGVAEPYLLGIGLRRQGDDFRKAGFDGTVLFEPRLGAVPGVFTRSGQMDDQLRVGKLLRNLRHGVVSPRLKIYDYTEARRSWQGQRPLGPFYSTVVVGWDNTPRRGRNAIIFINSTPDRFQEGLEDTIRSVLSRPPEDRLVFVNAWNEWAEGNYLEPDLDDGLGFLEAVRRANAIPENGKPPAFAPPLQPSSG